MADPDIEMAEERDLNPESLQRILQILKRNGLKEAEEALSKEAGSIFGLGANLESEPPSNSLSADNVTVNDANALSREYEELIKYVDSSFDSYKPELAALLYPIFANGYMDLILTGQADAGRAFLQRFGSLQPSWYSDDVHTLSRVLTPSQAVSNELVDNLRKHPFMLKMSKSCVKQLEPFLSRHPLIKGLIKEHLLIEAVDCGMRLKDTVEAMSGGVLGEASKQSNKQKVYYGTIKEDFSSQLPSFLHEDSKKKRAKSKDAKEGKKKDPNAPAFDRIPLPDWSDSVKSDKRQAQKETLKKVKISAENPPSVCFFSILNAHGGACCADITEDTTMMVAGYGNSSVQVFSLNQDTLKQLKPMEQLEMLDQEAEDIFSQVLDESKGSQSIVLKGHSGPVYGTSFSPDKRLLLSCGEDSTIRLWSTQLWSNLVSYRVGGYPIWDVKFSARGYYFATAGADRTAMLWSTDKMQPIRLFADSFSDVNCLDFHPNCNYIVGGGEDRYVRLWDVQSGTCVRQFTGHKGGVTGVKFSPDGRYIASAGTDGRLLVWDIALQKMAAMHQTSEPHFRGMTALAFSREGNTLAAGGVDNCVRLFSMEVATTHTSSQEHLTPDPKVNPTGFELFNFRTKQTPVLALHFSRKNLLVGIGAFGQ